MGKWIGRIAIRFGLVFAGFVVLFTVLAATGNRSLQREVGQWRESGLIDAQTAAADHTTGEAYRLWVDAVDAVRRQSDQIDAQLEARPASASEASAWLAELSPAIEAARAAALSEGPITAAGPSEPYLWVEQWWARLHEARRFVRLLDAAASWHATAGDRAAAAEMLEAGLMLADRAAEPGVWFAQLERLALLHQLLDSIEQLYADAGLPPRSLRDRLAAIDLRAELVEAFRAEGVFELRLVSDTDPATSRVNWSTRGWSYHDAAYLMEQYRTCIDMLGDAETSLTSLPLTDDAAHPFWARKARVVLPMVHASLGRRLAVQVRLAMARTAFGLREQAAATGEYPDMLADAEALRVDPGFENPIRYERTSAGFVLRSAEALGGEPIEWRWR